MRGASTERLPLTVRETLDTVMAPAVRDAVLGMAFQRAGVYDVPTDPDAFRDFVQGSLRVALVEAIGRELGDSVVEELGRLVAIAGGMPSSQPPSSGSRKTAERSNRLRTPRPISSQTSSDHMPAALPRSESFPLARISTPAEAADRARTQPSMRHDEAIRLGAPPPSSAPYPVGTADVLAVRGARTASGRALPFVLVATQDTRLVQQLSAWLDPRAAVVRVRSLIHLLRDLEDAAGSPIVIILDCRQPSVRPPSLAALAEELPRGVQVVMWGATPEMEHHMVMVSELARNWFVCSAHADPKDVAERCAELIL